MSGNHQGCHHTLRCEGYNQEYTMLDGEDHMGNRPDFKQIKQMLSHAAAIDSTMKTALAEENAEISNVRKAAEAFYNDKFQVELEPEVKMIGEF